MLPAQQRFIAYKRVIQLHDALIMQQELVASQANAGFRQQAAARFGFIGHAAVITAPAAAARRLGPVQCQIGLLEDAGQCHALVFRRTVASADRDGKIMARMAQRNTGRQRDHLAHGRQAFARRAG